jgi:hypothetical protein
MKSTANHQFTWHKPVPRSNEMKLLKEKISKHNFSIGDYKTAREPSIASTSYTPTKANPGDTHTAQFTNRNKDQSIHFGSDKPAFTT